MDRHAAGTGRREKTTSARLERSRVATHIVLVLAIVTIAGVVAWLVTALVSVPVNSASNPTQAKDRAIALEAVQGCAMIRSQLSMYASQHNGNFPMLSSATGDELARSLEMGQQQLDGKYFKARDFVVNSSDKEYTVRVAWGDQAYIVNQDGVESGTFKPAF